MRYLYLKMNKVLFVVNVVFFILLCLLLYGRNSRLHILLQGPMDAADPELIDYIKSRCLIPPSTDPYNLKADRLDPSDRLYNGYRFRKQGWPELQRIIATLFGKRTSGFFVEAGALDGEYLSNTLDLEKRGWEGLLVEPDGEMFALLTKKKRKAWAVHACLATKPYPMKTTLIKLSKSVNEFDDKDVSGSRAHNFVLGARHGSVGGSHIGYQTFEQVQCFPLQSILKAMGARHVDLVSLDVEGVEREILRSYWTSCGSQVDGSQCIKVDVWIVEHDEDSTFVTEFSEQGYTLYTVVTDVVPFNYVFIRNGSSVHNEVFGHDKVL